MNNSILLYILLTARRDWLYGGIYLLLVFITLISIFFGGTALVEQNATTAVFLCGSSRLVINIGLILFTCFHIKRSFENKEIDMFLTKPIARYQFVLHYFAGVAFLSFSIIFPFILILLLFLKSGLLWGHQTGYILWGISLYFETLILLAFALFASLTLNSVISSIFLCMAFYIFSRLFGYFLIVINNPLAIGLNDNTSIIYKNVLWGIGMFMPRLDRFANTEWIVYGVDSLREFLNFNLSSFIYIAMLLSMAIYDFQRREF